MTISGLTKGRVFGESQVAKHRHSPAPAGPSPAPTRRVSCFWALDLLAESQITATPRHCAPGAGACPPAQRSGHQDDACLGEPSRPERRCYAVTGWHLYGLAETILVFEQMPVPRWLAETVVRAAQVTGVDPAYLMALADKESSLLP